MADRPLVIGIDGRELVGAPTGVGRYLWSVLREWTGPGSPGHQLQVVVPADPPDSARALGDRVEWIVEPAEKAGTVWEQTRLRQAIARLRPDAFFGVGYTAPLAISCPVVLVVHDVSFFAHPEWFSARDGLRRRLITRACARRAHAVVTVSEFSRREILRYLKIPSARIHLAPPGAPSVSTTVDDGPREPLVLFAGSLFNRRRIPDLLAAFAETVRLVPSARLILAGDNRTTPAIDPLVVAAALGISTRVEWRRYVSDLELEALYRRARVFAFLSDYEGFAMTPAEALACGAAPILADTEVAREVYGDGARLVPLDPHAIAAAMSELLTDEGAHRRLVAAGRARMARFTWASTAATIQRLIEAAAQSR